MSTKTRRGGSQSQQQHGASMSSQQQHHEEEKENDDQAKEAHHVLTPEAEGTLNHHVLILLLIFFPCMSAFVVLLGLIRKRGLVYSRPGVHRSSDGAERALERQVSCATVAISLASEKNGASIPTEEHLSHSRTDRSP